METLRAYLAQHGRSVALYSNKHSIFLVNHPDSRGRAAPVHPGPQPPRHRVHPCQYTKAFDGFCDPALQGAGAALAHPRRRRTAHPLGRNGVSPPLLLQQPDAQKGTFQPGKKGDITVLKAFALPHRAFGCGSMASFRPCRWPATSLPFGLSSPQSE